MTSPFRWLFVAGLLSCAACGPAENIDDQSALNEDADSDGYLASQDCDDNNALVFPGSEETANDRDDDCDNRIDEDTAQSDDDGDGYTETEGDLDDSDPSIFPDAPELPDEKDNDQDGVVDEGTILSDLDEDGHSTADGDRDDTDASVYPGAPELEDGKDNDQDDTIDEGTASFDDDGDGISENDGDCDDSNGAVSPFSQEICDDLDNDCDEGVDESGVCFTDSDGDGIAFEEGDCNDSDPAIFPGQPELEDQEDNDCDGLVDEGSPSFDDDGDGYTENEGDCNDDIPRIHPSAPETSQGLPDGIDNDCDGIVDEGTAGDDLDEDGYPETQDCDDSDASTHPNAPELEDGKDNDCDDTIDEDTPSSDDDLDGFSDNDGDCDDNEALVFPGSEEVCDGLDNDCSGFADEPCVPCAIPSSHTTLDAAIQAGCREIGLEEDIDSSLAISNPSSSIFIVGLGNNRQVGGFFINISTRDDGLQRDILIQGLTLTGPTQVTNLDDLASIQLMNLTMQNQEGVKAPLDIKGPNVIVSDSTFLNNSATSSADASGAIRLIDSQNFKIIGNRFEGNEVGRYLDDVAGAVYIGGSSHGLIDNNLFLRNRVHGSNGAGALFFEPEVQDTVYIRNNTFVENENTVSSNATSIHCQGSFSGGIIEANIHWNESGSHIKGCDLAAISWSTFQDTPAIAGDNNSDVDPLLLDETDCFLNETSPARNAGSPEVERSNIDGSRNDQGYTGGPDGLPL